MPSILPQQPIVLPTPVTSRRIRWGSRLLAALLTLHPFLLTASLSRKALAATLSSTAIYVIEGTATANNRNIRTIDANTGALSATIFTSGVGGSSGMGFDTTTQTLYYADRTTTPNQLRRYDGTSESGSLGTFPGTTSSSVVLRIAFYGATGYGIDGSNNIFSFTNTAPSTITSLGAVSFQGTSPSGSTASGDIAFDGNGHCWGIFGNSLYRMDFNSSPIKAYPIGQVNVGGVALSTASNTVVGTAFDAAGNLLISSISGTTTTIYRVDVNDASAVQIGSALAGNVITDFASGNTPNLNPNIVATKSVSPTGNVQPGATLTYTIEVENTGNAPAVVMTFTDSLPSGTTYVANSATLNGTILSAAAYPFGSAYAISGRNASSGAMKVGYANRATITFQVTVNTVSPPSVVNNSGVITYLDGPGGGVPTNQTTTNVVTPVNGYKSVKLTTDADSSGSVTPGDTLTWTLSYKNTTALAVANFQINDPLPAGVTINSTGGQTVTVSGTGTSASKNLSYTGAAVGAVSDLLAAGATLGDNGVVTVTIATTVNTGVSGTLSNQAAATGSTIATSTNTDNVDSTTGGLPSGVTVPASSIAQTQGAGVDPTTVSVTATVTIAGKVWDDADNSANNTFTNINTGAETGTNASGALHAILVNSGGNVLATTTVNSDGTYSFSGVISSQSNVIIRLATSAGTVAAAAPTAGVPTGWASTSPLTTTAFNIASSNITDKDFGIEQLPIAVATDPASQTNPGGTTLVAVPSTHFTGTDADGTIASFKFTAFPTNVTSITINGTSYTSGTFPGAGITVTAVSGALPASMVSIDPTDGTVTVAISFTVTDNGSKESTAAATVNVVFASPPSIALVKNCPAPATCLTASQPPGTDLTYSITFTNGGGSSAQSLAITDAIPDNTDFKVSSVTTSLGTTGLTVTVEYSSDYNASSPGAATWTYTPASGSGGADFGYDRSVKAIRWRVTAGNLSATAPNNAGSIGFTVKIR